ncbi:Histidine phosphatase superfamily clade-2 [Penicillium sp. DV-2018c]|nr:Histidine phosphatase superfamily clade-2 [Penicillium sp. DV-2018c]KAJ5572091.1 Histidine phosphatase superfamily clade-2 [Penicillium sp. DV-2018c]
MAGHGTQYSLEAESLRGEEQNPRWKKQKQSRTRKWIAQISIALLVILVLAVYCVTRACHESSHSTTVMSIMQPDVRVASFLGPSETTERPEPACNTVNDGYQCNPAISHQWGQYSPYFSLAEKSAISDEVPDDCEITFVQVVSRHGARYPSADKSEKYAELIGAIKANATEYKGKLEFLRSYDYELGSDDLTPFGERQMVDSGFKFYQRYKDLTRQAVPFIRSSDSDRVIASGKKFIKGFKHAKTGDKRADHRQPSPKISVIISEEKGFNNSLNHNTCQNFEDDGLKDDVEDDYTAIFAPPIRTRLEADLPGVQLENKDVPLLMDLCPFETVSPTFNATTQSPFCDLFTRREWKHYNYLQSLSKYYGYGAGNPLGPAQGIGLANELIARLTRTPVHDETSTNHTLDAPDAATFPLNHTVYADFTHDNGMIPFFFALGLYNSTAPLPRTHLQPADEADGYSAAWTVPFAARAYIEMMQCPSDPDPEPFVRVIVNDRVVHLHGCSVDSLGRCRRRDFVDGLTFARSGGNWDQCFD